MTTEYQKIASGKWNTGWMNIISNGYYTTIDGKKHVSFYAYNPKITVDNFTTNYISMNGWSFSSKFSWVPGFTHFAFYGQYFLAYSSNTGKAGMYKVNKAGTGIDTVIPSWQWSPGWSHVVELGPNFFFYNEATGEMRYSHIHADSSGKPLSISEGVGVCEWAPGWTHFTRVNNLMVVYNANTGHARIDSFESTASKYAYTNLLDTQWNPGWLHIKGFTESYTKDSEWPKSHNAMFLVLASESTGVYARLKPGSCINTGPSFSSPYWTSMITFDNVKGWKSGYAGDMTSNMSPLILAYNANTGNGKYEIGSINIPFS